MQAFLMFQILISPCRILSFSINAVDFDTNKMKIDSAVIKALSLDPAKTVVAKHGGSGFSTTAKKTEICPGFTLNRVSGEHRFIIARSK